MVNKNALTVLTLFSLLLSACSFGTSSSLNNNSNSSSDTSSDSNPYVPPEEQTISYKDIYHFECQKSGQLLGKSLYRASDGYIDNTVQGYNNFYYQLKSNNEYNNLLYEDDSFKSNGVVISQDKMTSVADFSATRCFLCPETGFARISGSVFLVNGTSAYLKVFQNSTLIFEKEVDADGVFHSNDVNVTKNDNIYFVIEGNATVSYNPVIDYTLASEMSLHHSADGYYGDVHPFYDYDSKKMHMFYLSTGQQTGIERYDIYRSMLTTSTDLIHYVDEPIQMNERGRPEQDLYFVLNVFKDKNGVYRSSEGMANHITTSISSDLHTWSNGTEAYVDPADDLFKYRYAAYYDDTVFNGRDPDMCYYQPDDCYYAVSIVYHTSLKASGRKSIQLYTGNNKGEFASTGHTLIGFEGRGDPECPQIKHIGDRWYVFYSVYGTGTKGNVGKFAYRVGDKGVNIKDVDWESKPELYLDGEDLHAAQINEIGDKYYYFGWLNYRYNTSVWGGYLNLPHEVYQEEDGTLRSRLDEELLRLLNKGLIYKDNATRVTNENINIKLTRNLITADVELINSSRAGLKITHGSDTFFIGLITKANGKYLTVKNDADGYYSEVLAKNTNRYHLTISLDGNCLDINANNDTTISAFTNLTDTNKSLDIEANGNSIKNLKINQLADYNNIYF